MEWMKDNVFLGFLVFTGIVFTSTVLFIPGSIVLMGCGFAFAQALHSLWKGLLLGFASAFVGAQLGSLAALVIGRFIFRDQVEKRFIVKYPILIAINRSIEVEGPKLIFLMRLCPIMPFLVLNYLMGVTKITIWQYFLGGFGMIPNTTAYIYFGTALQSFTSQKSK
jgi:uncharacterized membrane protein YdjX (TVP38/TMEM64 family)